MRYWVGITDHDWFRFLAAQPEVPEVNFWQPSAGRRPVTLDPGALFLFKLHAGQGGFIVGGGFFTHYLLENGLLLRKDLHALFDAGYVTVTPSLELRVSRRIREEFENGRDYYALEGASVRVPLLPAPPPSPEYLQWHGDAVFRG